MLFITHRFLKFDRAYSFLSHCFSFYEVDQTVFIFMVFLLQCEICNRDYFTNIIVLVSRFRLIVPTGTHGLAHASGDIMAKGEIAYNGQYLLLRK